jgi:hypothetical protein
LVENNTFTIANVNTVFNVDSTYEPRAIASVEDFKGWVGGEE